MVVTGWPDRKSPNPQPIGRNDDHRSSLEFGSGDLSGLKHKRSLFLRPVLSPSQEHQTRGGVSTEREQLAEVRVSGDEHPLLRSGGRHHGLIVSSEQTPLADVYRVMAGVNQQLSNLDAQRLVDEEPHPAERSGSSRSSTAAAA